jgi:hypothetical protein
MPMVKDWNSGKRQVHDRRLKKAGKRGKDAVSLARTLRADLARMNAIAERVVRAVLGRRDNASSSSDLQVDDLIASLQKKGVEILKAGPQNLTPAQKKTHRVGLRAISPLIRKSVDTTMELSKCLSEIHQNFDAIVKMYDDQV